MKVFRYLNDYLSTLNRTNEQAFRQFKSDVLARMRDLVIDKCIREQESLTRVSLIHFRS